MEIKNLWIPPELCNIIKKYNKYLSDYYKIFIILDNDSYLADYYQESTEKINHHLKKILDSFYFDIIDKIDYSIVCIEHNCNEYHMVNFHLTFKLKKKILMSDADEMEDIILKKLEKNFKIKTLCDLVDNFDDVNELYIDIESIFEETDF